MWNRPLVKMTLLNTECCPTMPRSNSWSGWAVFVLNLIFNLSSSLSDNIVYKILCYKLMSPSGLYICICICLSQNWASLAKNLVDDFIGIRNQTPVNVWDYQNVQCYIFLGGLYTFLACHICQIFGSKGHLGNCLLLFLYLEMYDFVYVEQLAQMPQSLPCPSVSWEAPPSMRGEWRSTSTGSGALSVTISGDSTMRMWCAGSSGTDLLRRLLLLLHLGGDPDPLWWMMWIARESRAHCYLVAFRRVITVHILRMPG